MSTLFAFNLLNLKFIASLSVREQKIIVIKTKKTVAMDSVSEGMSCPLCLELFDNPLLFPCGHSFCRECLLQYKRNSKFACANKLPCPKCRGIVILNTKGIDALPKNFSLAEIITALKTREGSDQKNEKSRLCIDHQKELELYCETCEQIICWRCSFTGDHKGHEAAELDDAYARRQRILKDEKISFLRQRETNLSDEVKRRGGGLKNIQKEQQKHTEQIEQSFRRIYSTLQKKSNSIMQYIANENAKACQIYVDSLRNLEEQKDQVTTLASDLNKSLIAGKETFLEIYSDLISRTEDVENIVIPDSDTPAVSTIPLPAPDTLTILAKAEKMISSMDLKGGNLSLDETKMC